MNHWLVWPIPLPLGQPTVTSSCFLLKIPPSILAQSDQLPVTQKSSLSRIHIKQEQEVWCCARTFFTLKVSPSCYLYSAWQASPGFVSTMFASCLFSVQQFAVLLAQWCQTIKCNQQKPQEIARIPLQRGFTSPRQLVYFEWKLLSLWYYPTPIIEQCTGKPNIYS